MQVVAFSPLEFLLLILLGGGFGSSGVPAPEDPLLARIAPAECLVYSSWAGTSAADPDSGNHSERLLAEPDIQAFVHRSREEIFNLMAIPFGGDPQQQQLFTDIRGLLRLIEGKPGAFFISHIPFSADTPRDMQAAAMLRVDDDSAKFQALLERLMNHVSGDEVTSIEFDGHSFSRVQIDPAAPSLTWGVWNNYLVVGVGDGAAEAMVQRSGREPPVWLTDARARLRVPRPSSVLYVHVKKFMRELVEAAGDAQAAHVLSVLGLDDIESFATVSGLDESGCLTRSLLSIDGPGRGLLSWIGAPPLTADDLQIVDRQTPVVLSFKLDPTAVFDLWLNMASRIDPETEEQFSREVAELNQQLAIDLREDVLESFGDTWRLFAQPDQGGVITGWTAAVHIRDRARLEKTLETLSVLANGLLHRGGPDAPSITRSDVHGHTIYTIDLKHLGTPYSPSWCLTDRELLITATKEALLPMLDGERGESLATLPEVRRLLENEFPPLAMVYIDMERVARTLLPLARAAFQAVAGQAGAQRLDTSRLPPADVFLRHLQPTIMAVQRTGAGIEFSTRHTVPGANLGAAAPVAVAMMLPAVNASRQAARRTQSMNQLKQIALAMHNYHDVHGSFPAGYSADAEGKPLLSWRVHVLPFLEEADLYQRFHLDEPWNSEHNKTLIAEMPDVFRSPGSAAEVGKSNYLGVGGKDGVFIRPQPGDKLGTEIRQIVDGTSNTIMTVEVSDESAVIWTRPGDFAPDDEQPTTGLIGIRPGGFLAGLADGSVRFVSQATDAGTLKAMFTKSGGEVVR